ncbi:MAG: hypothetical protein R3B70_12335 [Polyangiaceae bacterium]
MLSRHLLGHPVLAQARGDGDRVHPDVLKDTKLVLRALRNIVFLDIQPARMRDYRPEHAHVLGTSGRTSLRS